MSIPVSEIELVLRKYGCRRCGSMPGDRCKSRTGKVLAHSHADRFRTARDEGALPGQKAAS